MTRLARWLDSMSLGVAVPERNPGVLGVAVPVPECVAGRERDPSSKDSRCGTAGYVFVTLLAGGRGIDSMLAGADSTATSRESNAASILG